MKSLLLRTAYISAFCASCSLAIDINQNENFIEILKAQTQEFGITQDKLAKCDPAISGTYEYVKDGLIRLYPRPALNAGTTYKCAMDGQNFVFTTAPFTVRNLEILRPGFAVVGFNDEVDASAIKKGIRVYSLQNLAKNDISFNVTNKDERNFFITYDAKAKNVGIDIAGVSSKTGVDLDEAKSIKDGEELFTDSINATNLDDVQIRATAFDDGSLGAKIYFPHYVDTSDLAKYIRISGIAKFSVGELEYRGSYGEDSSVDSKYYNYVEIKSAEFEPNKSYEVRLLRGFGDSEKIVRDEIKQSIKTGDRTPFAAFSDTKSYVSKNADIAIKSTNLSEIKVVVSKIKEENFRYFLNFDSDKVRALATKIATKSFDIGGEKNKINENKISMDFKSFKDGVYLITAFYKADDDIKEISRIAYISDISAQATLARDGALIYATRLSDAKALSHAIIRVYSDKNELLLEKRTDGDGVLHIKDMKILDANPASVEILSGKERGFVLLKDAVASVDATISDMRALVYLASDLISPNEELLGTIALKKSDFSAIANTPIKYRITDPSGVTVFSRAIKTDEFGSASIKEVMGEKSGTYNLELIFEDKIIAQKGFNVENFVPNRVKNEILTSKEEYNKDELITAKLASNYLAGAPASALNARLEVKAYEKNLKIDGFSGFSFVNDKLATNTVTLLDDNFVLNNNGEKELIIAPNNLGVSNVAEILLNFIVKDGGKNVSAYKNLTFLPFDKIVGIRANNDFISAGDSAKFDLVLLNASDKKEIAGNLDIEIYRQDYSYIYNGSRYVEQENFALVDTLSTQNRQFKHKFENGGIYVIVANDYASGASASARVDVSGWGYSGKINAKDVQTARVKLEKTKVKPGEIIKGVITSPIENGVLNVALVGDGVYDYKISQIKGNSAKFELKVPENFAGGHVSASISRVAKGATMPLRTYANIPVSLDASDKKADVKIISEAVYKNGANAKINVQSAPNSKVVLYAADLGVLDVINQRELDAFSFFDKPLYFAMQYFDIYDDLSVYATTAKALSFGGDRMLKNAKRNLSPVENKKDKKFIKMYKSVTGADGVASFDIALPQNFNSMIRLSALALGSGASVGSVNSQISVKDDIVIKPADLTYMVKGDDIDIPLTIINTTNSKKDLSINVSANEILSIKLANDNLSLEPLSSAHLIVRTTAKELGAASVKFDVNASGENFTNELKFDIVSQFPRSKFVATSYGDKPVKFSLDKSYKDVYTYAGTTPPMHALARDLELYPYGCTEQLTSKMVALDFLAHHNNDDGKKTAVLAHATKILSRLKPNGVFGYWNEHGETQLYPSLWASDVLLEMDDRYKFLTKSQRNLILDALGSAYDGHGALRTYAAFVLDRYGKLSQDELNYIYDNKLYIMSQQAKSAMLAILSNHKMSREYAQAINEKLDNEKMYEIKNFASPVRDAGFMLYTLGKSGVKNKELDKIALELSQNFTGIASTNERANVLRGFEAYFGGVDGGVDVTLGANSATQNVKTPANTQILLNSDIREISITPNGGDKIFTSVLSFGYEPVAVKHKPLTITELAKFGAKKKIEIYREFVDEKGKAVNLNNLKVGQRIYSKISFRSDGYLQNFVIDDAVSTCFEVINERISGGFKRPDELRDITELNNREYMYDRVLSFPRNGFYHKDAKSGVDHTSVFYTPLNVVYAGSCALPAVSITDMQNENVNAYDLETLKFEVK